ncbi:MAG: metallophosphoesterase [Planctomycetota bacterium]
MTQATKLLENVDLPLSAWPAHSAPLRVVHVTDLHVRGRVQKRHRRLAAELRGVACDLACFTGDAMSNPGQEPSARETLKMLCEALSPRLGWFGVYGNHDSPELVERCADLPIRWLDNDAVEVDRDGVRVEVTGLHVDRKTRPDAPKLAHALGELRLGQAAAGVDRGQTFRLMLAHFPMALPIARDLGVDLLLAGHTHGGQVRLPGGRLLVNSCDMPLDKSTGVLRMGATTAAVSRGLGEVGAPGARVRVLCPPHCPVYEIGHAQGDDSPGVSATLEQVRAW